MSTIYEITLNEYAQLIEQHGLSAVMLFQSPKWLESVQQGLSLNCRVLTCVEDETVVALLPVFLKKAGPILLAGSPIKGSYTPYIDLVWIVEKYREKRNVYILECIHYLQKKYKYVEFGFHPDKEPPEKLPLDPVFSETYILPVSGSQEEVWDRIESRAKNMVRKAQKNEVLVHRLNGTEEEIGHFYRCLEETFSKSGVSPPHPKVFYTKLMQNLGQNQVLFLGAKYQDQWVAYGLFPFDQKEIHYLSGTSTQTGNSVAANSLIQWEVIQFAVQNGIPRYDLGGAGIPSIDKFKASFGASKMSYGRYVWMAGSFKLFFGGLIRVYSVWRKIRFALKRKP